MKRRFLALLLAAVLGIQGFGGLTVGATDIPEDCETIEFDRKYWAEPGETYWYKFTAPAPKCVFTDMQIDEVGDWLYGYDVTAHRYYDADGNELGTISYTNDPDVSEWTEFEVGETYYIKVNALKEGTFYTLSPIRDTEPSVDSANEGYKGGKSLDLTAENVEKFVMGNVNTKWDVYTVTEEFKVGTENEVTSTDFFVLPYKVCFGDSELTVDKRMTTYTSVDHTAQTSWDVLSSFVKKPYAGKENISDGDYVQAANHYAYVMDGEAAAAIRSYKVYVPAGKRIKLADDGCFYEMPVNERFSDVSANAWYTEAISWASENKVMKGMGEDKFSPATALTRAQFVMILANIEGADLSVYKDTQSFSDVPKGRWYSAAIEWAKDKGVTSGVSDDRFAPDDNVTRQQLARFLCTYAGLRDIEMPEGADLGAFKDESKIADWAKDSMKTAVAAGLVTGMTEDTLAPRDNATRAQISLIVKRFYEGYLKAVTPSVDMGNYLLEGGSSGYSFNGELLNLAGKEDAHVLYIGMACTDPTEGYGSIKSLMSNWTDKCTFDILLLEDLPTDAARQKIEAADIIYVTGGSSRMLLERLRRYGTDAIIRDAAAKGTVMSGSSAGAICFGSYGTSGIRDDRFENLYGTGCVNVIVCPHGNEQKRVDEMKRLILKDATLVGVAVDYASLEISGGMYRIFTEEGYQKIPVAVRYWNEDGEIKSEDINSMEWRPIDELYNP